jgi:enoyl-CoA hydratase/carnithine racemase
VELSAGAYADLVRSPYVDEHTAVGPDPSVWILDAEPDPGLPGPGSIPVVVLARGASFGGDGPHVADAVVADADLDAVLAQVGAAPRSAAALAVLLRSQADLDVEAALAAESAVYSMLQAGPEFAAWRAERSARPVQREARAVEVGRDGATLRIALDRPHRRNAISAQLRDELAQALALALTDETIERVVLTGNGPSFSAGGDLDEFGTRPDPATAHLARLARSPARLVHRLRERVEAQIHGVTLGGGIELAAFAATVVATPGTEIGLPEIGLGLIPGAGGTVSITRRIGRQRTAALALSGRRVGAGLALEWGLVDRIAG